MKNYESYECFRKLVKHTSLKVVSPRVIVIENGSIGIKLLGVVSYLNKKTRLIIRIVSERPFNSLKNRPLKVDFE